MKQDKKIVAKKSSTKTVAKKVSKKKIVFSKEETALVLRQCKSDMSSYNNFVWPTSGHVCAPDWEPTKECGKGLHGFLWGEGDGSLADHSPESKWLVVSVKTADIIDLSGKVKFPEGEVVFCGTRYEATEYLKNNGGAGRAIIGGTSTSGFNGTSTSGYNGTSTSGNSGTSTSGDNGTSTSGEGGIIHIKWYDIDRYRVATGYVGEDGIESNVEYVVVDGKLTKKV